MKKQSLFLIGLLALGSTAGCSYNVNQSVDKNSNASAMRINHKNVIADPSLNQKASVPEIVKAKRGNLLEIMATLQNNTSSEVSIYCKVDWYDSQGIIIRSNNSRWQKYHLKGKETIFVTSLSTSSDAVDFRLKLQEK